MNKKIVIMFVFVFVFLGFWTYLTNKKGKTIEHLKNPLVVLSYEVIMEIPPFEQKYVKHKDGNFHLVKNSSTYKIKFNSSWGENSQIDLADSLVSKFTDDHYSWLNIDSLSAGKIIEKTRIVNLDDTSDVYEHFTEYEVVKDDSGYVLSENSLQNVCDSYELGLIGQYSATARQNLKDYYEKVKTITGDTTKSILIADEIQNITSNFAQISFLLNKDTLTLSTQSTTSIGIKFSAQEQ
jgi:hypothetical protein